MDGDGALVGLGSLAYRCRMARHGTVGVPPCDVVLSLHLAGRVVVAVLWRGTRGMTEAARDDANVSRPPRKVSAAAACWRRANGCGVRDRLSDAVVEVYSAAAAGSRANVTTPLRRVHSRIRKTVCYCVWLCTWPGHVHSGCTEKGEDGWTTWLSVRSDIAACALSHGRLSLSS